MDKILILQFTFIFCFIEGESDYQISIPEFICDKSNDVTDTKDGKTVIGLSGQGDINFRLNFERIGNPCGNNQRCNLMIWKVVRDFEKYLNNYPYAQTNSIVFNNSMLLPGLRYIFNIYVTLGKEFQQKQFNLDFVDSFLADSINKKFATVSLIGASSTEAHMPYILNANVDICSNSLDYYLEWELLDCMGNIMENFSERGVELTIPSFTFESGKQYSAKFNLKKMENDEILASDSKLINVKNHTNTLIAKLPMEYTTMQVRQTISIKPYIIDLGNLDGEMKIEWYCKFNNTNVCKNQYGDFLNIEGGFPEEGEYVPFYKTYTNFTGKFYNHYIITLTVSKGSMKTADSCTIKIRKNVPSIEFDSLQFPVSPSSGVEIKANVEDVRTFCTLQWKSTDLDLKSIPGNVDELFQVIAKRDLFLKELEEFSNGISNKEHDLLIPPSTENWKGLPNQANNYRLHFVLEAKCPKVQMQNNTEIEYSDGILNDTVMVSAMVEVDVNVPPKVQPLIVEPFAGVAFETIFTFQTEKAVETGTRGPFLYKFGYLLGDRHYVFCNMLDHMQCETTLPYIDNGVRTFLEVCDSFNSCEKIFGPVVDISLPNQLNETKVLQFYREKINTEDFQKAFGYALAVLFTSRALKEENKYLDDFSREVSNKIQYLLKRYSDGVNWAKRVNKLIKYIRDFNKELLFSDEVVNSLVDLRTKLLSEQKENLVLPGRKLLAISKDKTDLDNFKSYLDVSDIIIGSSRNKTKVEFEKQNLRRKINQFMSKFCMEVYQTGEKITLVFRFVILEIEKLQKKMYNEVHIIPYKGNPWNTTAEIKFNTVDMIKLKNEPLCIAKTMYKNIFNNTRIIYEFDIVNAKDGTSISDIKNSVLIPVDEDQPLDKIPKCLMYSNERQTQCKFIKILAQYAQCSCSVMGGYYLEYEDEVLSTPRVVQGNFSSTKGDDSRESAIETVNSYPSTTKSTFLFDITTKTTHNFNNSSNIAPTIFETISISSSTELQPPANILPSSVSENPITTTNSNIEMSSLNDEDNNTVTESLLLTKIFSLLSTSVANTCEEIDTGTTTSCSSNTTSNVTEVDDTTSPIAIDITSEKNSLLVGIDNVTEEITSSESSFSESPKSEGVFSTLITKTNSNNVSVRELQGSAGFISGEITGNFSIHFSLNASFV